MSGNLEINMDNLQDQLSKLQQSNVDKVNALGKLGKMLNSDLVANTKIDVFVKTFLDEQAQLVYLYNLETDLAKILDEALKQARQSQLTNKLIVPR